MSNKEVLVTGEILEIERRGWSRPCFNCNVDIRYTVLNINTGIEPFLYSNTTSDFVLREEDREAIQKSVSRGDIDSLEAVKSFYIDLENNLPPCPTGGLFRIWANVRCPHCGYEFPYAGGEKNEEVRFFESKIIWVEGATVFRGARVASNILVKVRIDS